MNKPLSPVYTDGYCIQLFALYSEPVYGDAMRLYQVYDENDKPVLKFSVSSKNHTRYDLIYAFKKELVNKRKHDREFRFNRGVSNDRAGNRDN